MADVKVVLSPDPIFLQGSVGDPTAYPAQSDRLFIQDAMGEGVRDLPAHFQASVVSGMTARFSPGVAYIRGKNTADQGTYRQYRSVDTDISAPAAHGSLPRLDQIILRVMDYTHDANASQLYEGRLEWIEGTATSGATLDNRLGAKDLTALGESSKSCILLWDYLMAAGTSSITFGNFRDKRVRATLGQGYATITPTGITNADIASNAAIGISKLAGYPSDSGKFLRGDGTWATLVIPSPKFARAYGVVGSPTTPNLNVVYDNDGMYSAGTPQRLTIQTAGYYLVSLSYHPTAGAANGNGFILMNGAHISPDPVGFQFGPNNGAAGGVSVIQFANVGNYFTVTGYCYDGSFYQNAYINLNIMQIV